MSRGKQLTAQDRQDIARSQDSVQDLAERYGCGISTIYRAKGRKTHRKAAAGISWKYSQEQIELAMSQYALDHGNAKRACENLRETLPELTASTLVGWINSEPQRYEKIRTEVVPTIHGRIANHHEDIAVKAAAATESYVERALAVMGDIAPRDMPGAARNLATVLAITTDKAALLRGKPTVIEERRDVGEILSALERMGVTVKSPVLEDTVEGTIVETLEGG